MKNVQKTARFAGVLYLLITVFAIIAHMYMPSTLIVDGDAATTAQNIVERDPLSGRGRWQRTGYPADRDHPVHRLVCPAQTRQPDFIPAGCRIPTGDDHYSRFQPN